MPNQIQMELNWLVIGIVIVGILALIFFLIRQNQKDEKDLEQKLNNDFKKPIQKESEPDEDVN